MNIRTTYGAVGALSLVLAGALGATSAAAVPSGDQKFAMQAAQAGMAEVADGKLALSKNATPKAKSIAETMIADHTMANKKLMTIAMAQGIKLPSSPDVSDQATMVKQRVLSGDTFSSTYLRDQENAHKKTIALLKNEISTGQDPQLVAFAKMTLPKVEGHLTMIDAALGSKM